MFNNFCFSKHVGAQCYRGKSWILPLIIIFSLAGCSSINSWKGVNYSEPDNALSLAEKVGYWKEQQRKLPEDSYILVRLREAQAEFIWDILQQGRKLEANNSYSKSLVLYQSALKTVPDNHELRQAIKLAGDRVMSDKWLKEARQLKANNGQLHKIQELLQEAVSVDPENQKAVVLLADIELSIQSYVARQQPTIDLHFKQIDFIHAIQFVGNSFGIDVIFDQSVKDSQVTLDVDDIAFKDAVSLLLSTTKHSYKVLNNTTLLIFADTKDRHKHFGERELRTFYLKTVAAKEMASLVKGVLGLSKVTVNEANNSLIVYDTREVIEHIERIVEDHDLLPGEVILEVEILEVNLSDADRLGLDYGAYQISANTTAVPVTGSISDAIKENTTLNIPSVNFNFFKQRVGAKLLANPSIRVLDGEKAKIHIGDRVPLRKSTIQDATGQTRTTFEYQEIGIRFNVEAFLNASEYVTVYASLEVSALGENLGTATEQAFRIGTRNADSTMLVRDGETAIMGGLIREEGRTTRSAIKGLGFLGPLSGNNDESSGRTDLLLTITPRVIRPASIRKQAATTNSFHQQSSPLDGLKLTAKALNSDVFSQATAVPTPKIVHVESIPESNKDDISDKKAMDEKAILPEVEKKRATPLLKFQESRYSVTPSERFRIAIDPHVWAVAEYARFSMIYNAQVVGFESAAWRVDQMVLVDVVHKEGSNKVEFVVDLSNETLEAPQGTLDIQLKALRSGTSFLVLQIEEMLGDDGELLSVDVVNSRAMIE